MNIADIVISLNGRDAGKRFIVIAVEDQYSLIADGKGRRFEKPKRKKNKHLKFEDKAEGPIASMLAKGDKVTNNELRRTLTEYTQRSSDAEAKTGEKDKNEEKGGVPKCQKTT